MQPYLESLPDHIDVAPPWTPTNRGYEITSRPLKHDLEISPRDSKGLRTDHRPIINQQQENTYHAYNFIPTSENQSSFVSHVESIPLVIPNP